MSAIDTNSEPKCHIHSNVPFWEIGDIHDNVCVNDLELEVFEGKPYCLFHKPTRKKNDEKFMEIFLGRIQTKENLIEQTEKEAVSKSIHDFRGLKK